MYEITAAAMSVTATCTLRFAKRLRMANCCSRHEVGHERKCTGNVVGSMCGAVQALSAPDIEIRALETITRVESLRRIVDESLCFVP
jgi:hypothetical protein